MRRLLASFLVIIILLSSSLSFAEPSSWALKEIERAKELNLVTERILGNYQNNITREEFCEMIIKLYESLSGETAKVLSQNPFTDTNNIEILKAYNLGIVDGVGEGKFAPNNTITREEIAVMYFRTLKVINPDLEASQFKLNFTDKDEISNWAKEAVAYMSNKEIINGLGNNNFGPKGRATREQAIALTVRIYDVFNKNIKPKEEKLTSVDIGKLADSVVLIHVETIDGNYSVGSGFFYEKGKVATNYHVIEGAKTIVLEYEDGSFYKDKITITGYSKEHDLATLSINDTKTKPLALGDSDTVKRGEKIYAIGSPRGLKNSLTDGIVSAVREDDIQINAAVNPGNSGGALINEYGEVIGIIYAKYKDSDNIAFAIPINLFKSLNKNLNLSIEAFNKETTISLRKISALELQNYINNYESYLYVNNIYIDFISTEVTLNDAGDISILSYIDWSGLDDYFNAERINLYNIAISLRHRCEFYSELTGRDVNMSIILSDTTPTYIPEFAVNNMFNDTISYINNEVGWLVFYPLITVNTYSNYYFTWYSNYRY